MDAHSPPWALGHDRGVLAHRNQCAADALRERLRTSFFQRADWLVNRDFPVKKFDMANSKKQFTRKAGD